MMKRHFGVFLMLACLWSAAEAQPFNVSISPEQPTPYEAITVSLELLSLQSFGILETRREDSVLVIEVGEWCRSFCPPPIPPFSEEVEFEPTLQSGDFQVELRFRDGSAQSEAFRVEGYFLQPRLTLDPPEPNDNQTVNALLSTLSWGGTQLSEMDRQGNTLDLLMTVPFPNILPPSPGPDAAVLDLGALEAGEHLIRLYTQDPQGMQRLVWVSDLMVFDAPDRAVLQDRFHVSVTWQDFVGNEGVGRPVPGASDDSTLFSFFERSNWELMVKVLDGCQQNDHFWVLAGGATNLGYDIEIMDTVTGNNWSVSNSLGQTATAVTDTLALPCQ